MGRRTIERPPLVAVVKLLVDLSYIINTQIDTIRHCWLYRRCTPCSSVFSTTSTF